jgi:hypothetical protein
MSHPSGFLSSKGHALLWRRAAHSCWARSSLIGVCLVALITTRCGLQKHVEGGSSADAGEQTAGSAGASGMGNVTGTGGQTSGAAGAGVATGTGGQTSSTGATGGTTRLSGGGVGGQAFGTAGTSGSAGASGAGVTINGTFVPKEKAVVFIHFGHSNMRGMASTPVSLKPYFYNTQAGLWSYKGSFTLAKEPTAPEGTGTLAGPGMAILHSAQAALSPGSGVQFISVGYGKGSATTVDYAKAGPYYPIFMNWAGQLKGHVTFGAIVVMLGITDGEHLPTAEVPGFTTRMSQIISDIRTDLGEPNLPVLFCNYEQNATGTFLPTGAIGVVMQPLINMLPTLVSNLALVPTDGLEMQDDHHFDMQGQKDWSSRVVMLMQSNGWFPWQ